ncbi:2-hydroxyacylsphingosine 1-beta-galactosyltransferase [Armadillidium nasatum]|uniref:UDP-glucuronosyltransferase n=1 Tax=Armadillidium nasatum TaxID=96803 RepID=A0A5N5T5R0_9CRUS|nr:2-hydroxyacylsphingosine 1-beta-galactosyltransferase [Armadillidium nasatum]
MQAKEENLWPPEVPDIFELLKQPAFAIINRPMSPSVVYVGGIHIKEPQPLPQELADWLDGSGEEGFIFFSLGTVIKAEHLKQEHISSILKVFGSLKQRILWKWNSEIKNLPSNVKISSWLPQQDILAHRKIRLFISHGGLFGSQEAMYFEVPVLGMPVFLDQHMNIDEIVSQGWGKSLAWDDLTEDTFGEAIQDILSNSRLVKPDLD